MPDPGYPIYESLTRFVGATPVPVADPDGRTTSASTSTSWRALVTAADAAADPEFAGQPDRRRPDPRGPRAHRRDRHPITTSGSSPTRSTARILYDGAEHVSIASLPGMAERTIVLDGFSKTFAMTGWRLGYAVVPPSLTKVYGQLIINTVSGAPTFAQVGGRRRADRSAGRCGRDGRRVPRPPRPGRRRPERDPGHRVPTAARRVLRVPVGRGTGLSGHDLAERLLEEAGVCVLPGSAFGGFGDDHIRVSYANSQANLPRSAGRGSRTFVGGTAGMAERGSARGLRGADHARRGTRADPRGLRRRRLGGRAPAAARRAAATGRGLRRRPDAPHRPRRRRIPGRGGPGLRVVANYAVGFDNIDVAACARRGVAVGNTPGVLTETTADLAWALLMAAARRVAEGDRYVRDGRWKTWGPMLLLGPDVHGATLGIVGLRPDRPGGRPARRGLRDADPRTTTSIRCRPRSTGAARGDLPAARGAAGRRAIS